MLLFLFLSLMYFLPSILGRDKRHALGILLLNVFLGWTIIGWIAALFWALSSEVRAPVVVVAGPGAYCCQCGTLSAAAGRFCPSCGRPV